MNTELPPSDFAESSLWVPPLLSAAEKMHDPARNPFFEHAEQQLFLAWRGGEAVGRIAATIDRLHAERHGEQVPPAWVDSVVMSHPDRRREGSEGLNRVQVGGLGPRAQAFEPSLLDARMAEVDVTFLA